MQFQLIILPVLVALASASPLDQSPKNPLLVRDATTQCFISTELEDVNTNSILGCMDGFISAGTWFDNVACAGFRWFLAGNNWGSPADCMSVGKACLTTAAHQAPTWAKCDAQSGVAHCWWAWCPVGKVPGGNADGSCS